MEEEELMDELYRFDNLANAMNDIGILVQDKYKESLQKGDRIATGALINSVKYIYSNRDLMFEISLNLEDYWKYIEYGTRPHFPPVSKILEWVKAKPVLPRPSNGKLPTEEQLAFLIARKISEVGTEGGHHLSETMDDLNEEISRMVEDALEKDLDRIGTAVIRTLM